MARSPSAGRPGTDARSAWPSATSAGATRPASTARRSSTGAPSAPTRRRAATTAPSSSTRRRSRRSRSRSTARAPTASPASCGPRRSNTGADVAPLDLVLKGWFHDPTRRVELIPNGLLLHGPSSVVAIIGTAPTSAQVSDKKRALDANLRDGALHGRRARPHRRARVSPRDRRGRLGTSSASRGPRRPRRRPPRRAPRTCSAGRTRSSQFRSDEADTLFRGDGHRARGRLPPGPREPPLEPEPLHLGRGLVLRPRLGRARSTRATS